MKANIVIDDDTYAKLEKDETNWVSMNMSPLMADNLLLAMNRALNTWDNPPNGVLDLCDCLTKMQEKPCETTSTSGTLSPGKSS